MKEKMVVNEEGMGIGTALTPGTDCMNLGGMKFLLNDYDWLGDPAMEF